MFIGIVYAGYEIYNMTQITIEEGMTQAMIAESYRQPLRSLCLAGIDIAIVLTGLEVIEQFAEKNANKI